MIPGPSYSTQVDVERASDSVGGVRPDEMVLAAIAVAEDGLRAGELPIGAVVLMGDDVVGRSWTQDVAQRR